MRAMLLDAPGTKLREAEIRRPELRPGEVRIRVGACGVCRTDLHIRDGELREPKLPLVLGHQIVGTVIEGDGSRRARASASPGWAGPAASAATAAPDARTCATARASPATRSTAATPRRPSPTRATAFRFPTVRADEELAPLLCAGLIGYRALRAAGDGESARPLRLRRRRAHRRAGRASRRTPRVRLHAARRRGSAVAGSRARRRVGGRRRRAARRSSTPRSSSRPRASSCPRRWRRSRRAARSSARAST